MIDLLKFALFVFVSVFILMLCLEEGLKRQEQRLQYKETTLGEYENVANN